MLLQFINIIQAPSFIPGDAFFLSPPPLSILNIFFFLPCVSHIFLFFEKAEEEEEEEKDHAYFFFAEMGGRGRRGGGRENIFFLLLTPAERSV